MVVIGARILCRIIRQNHGDGAPVVIGFTGDVMDEATNLFAASGAVAVMCKPYHMATIIRACVRAWHKAALLFCVGGWVGGGDELPSFVLLRTLSHCDG
jgi:CheY-like chemotaxis protein